MSCEKKERVLNEDQLCQKQRELQDDTAGEESIEFDT